MGDVTTGEIVNALMQAMAAGVIGPAFAMLFAVPLRFLPLIAAISALSRGIRAGLLLCDVNIVGATFIACAVCSLVFIHFGPKLKTPRPVFTVPCIISMIPGVDAYNALISLLAVIDDSEQMMMNVHIAEMFHRGMRSIGIIFAIALGLAVPPLFFYRYRRVEI